MYVCMYVCMYGQVEEKRYGGPGAACWDDDASRNPDFYLYLLASCKAEKQKAESREEEEGRGEERRGEGRQHKIFDQFTHTHIHLHLRLHLTR